MLKKICYTITAIIFTTVGAIFVYIGGVQNFQNQYFMCGASGIFLIGIGLMICRLATCRMVSPSYQLLEISNPEIDNSFYNPNSSIPPYIIQNPNLYKNPDF